MDSTASFLALLEYCTYKQSKGGLDIFFFKKGEKEEAARKAMGDKD